MTYLNTQTRDGRAYEIDMRLRPSGATSAGWSVPDPPGHHFCFAPLLVVFVLPQTHQTEISADSLFLL